MSGIVALLVVVAMIAVGVRVGLGLVADRWGVGSRADACAWASAMLVPMPGRTSADLVRAMGRRLSGLRFVTAAGESAAYAHVVVYVTDVDAATLKEQYGCALLEHELVAAYVASARKAGWRVPARVTVSLTGDARLARGRLFLDGRPGPLAEPSRTVPDVEATPTALDSELATLLRTEPAGTDRTVPFVPRMRVASGGLEHLLSAADRHVLGRDRDCALRLTDTSVSRQHAELWHAEGAWWLRDLCSSNGTRVDGRLSGTSRVLITGPVTVEFGACSVSLEPVSAPASRPAR